MKGIQSKSDVCGGTGTGVRLMDVTVNETTSNAGFPYSGDLQDSTQHVIRFLAPKRETARGALTLRGPDPPVHRVVIEYVRNIDYRFIYQPREMYTRAYTVDENHIARKHHIHSINYYTRRTETLHIYVSEDVGDLEPTATGGLLIFVSRGVARDGPTHITATARCWGKPGRGPRPTTARSTGSIHERGGVTRAEKRGRSARRCLGPGHLIMSSSRSDM